MRKLSKHFLIIIAVFLVLAVIISFFCLRSTRRTLTAGSKNNYSPLIVKIIDKFSRRQPETPKLEDTIQILEGWTSRDIGQYFERLGKWQSEEFLEVAGFPQVDYRRNKEMPPLKDLADKFSFLQDKPKYYGLEGYLFPDTYRIYARSTVAEVIDKMLVNFDQKLTPQMRADIKKQGRTIYEIVIIASIIEKEASINYLKEDDSDARIIAGIFLNRLKIGQPLQADATLSYILNDNKTQHSGRELEVDSPYNTYKYRGLPPGPICNPGRLAIEAAIYPLKTDYNYFLTPTGTQEVIYAKTYEEHLQNKYQYLK